MGGTKVNWDSQETWQRVVAAILATGVKVDLKQTALYFGTTYDTLENRFRKIKKESASLKEEVENGDRGEVTTPSRGTPKKKSTPKKDVLSNVTNGRVSKSTPKKKSSIKQETSSDSASFDMDGGLGDFSFTNSSFSFSHGINGAEDNDGPLV